MIHETYRHLILFLNRHVEELAKHDCDTVRWLKVLQGIMAAVQCFSEIPFFYFSGRD
jgi:hypothetical protein